MHLPTPHVIATAHADRIRAIAERHGFRFIVHGSGTSYFEGEPPSRGAALRALQDDIQREGLSDYWGDPFYGSITYYGHGCVDRVVGPDLVCDGEPRPIAYEPLTLAERRAAKERGDVIREPIRNFRPDRVCLKCGKRWFVPREPGHAP